MRKILGKISIIAGIIVGIIIGLPILTIVLWFIMAGVAQVENSFLGGDKCCKISQKLELRDYNYGCPNTIFGFIECAEPTDCIFHPGISKFPKNIIVGEGDCSKETINTCILREEEVSIGIESQEWGSICIVNNLQAAINLLFWIYLLIGALFIAKIFHRAKDIIGILAKIKKNKILFMLAMISFVSAIIDKIILLELTLSISW